MFELLYISYTSQFIINVIKLFKKYFTYNIHTIEAQFTQHNRINQISLMKNKNYKFNIKCRSPIFYSIYNKTVLTVIKFIIRV